MVLAERVRRSRCWRACGVYATIDQADRAFINSSSTFVQEQRLLDDLTADGQEHLTAGWSDAGGACLRSQVL